VGSDLSEDLFFHLGKAYATFRSKELDGKQLSIAIGRDMRETSVAYQEAFIKGATSLGSKVYNIGLVSTPAFYFSIDHLNADGGAIISASHNPAEYNGCKMVRNRAIPISGDDGIKDLADLIESEAYKASESAGSIKEITGIEALAAKAQIDFAGNPKIKSFNIIADTANGMGAPYIDECFNLIPGELNRMYWDLDGTFPNHEADPFKPENTEDLRAAIKSSNADIGIATDGDGDRIFLFDENGDAIEPEILRGLIGQIILRTHPGAPIGYDIRPGKITEDMIKESGGIPFATRVGHSFIKQAMIKRDSIFAGESSGHMYYTLPQGSFEAPVTVIAQILAEMTETGKSLSQIVAPFRGRYAHSGEQNFKVTSPPDVISALKEKYSDGEIIELDGLSVNYQDFWFNVRASNTQPLLRLNLEAVSSEMMEEKTKEITDFIKSKA